MKKNSKNVGIFAALAVSATLLAGCSSTSNNVDDMSGMSGMDHMSGMSGMSGSDNSSSSPSSNPYGTFSEGEVMFMQMLYPLQKQAIDMAGLVSSQSQNPKLAALAGKVGSMNNVHTSNLANYLSSAGSSPYGADAGAQLSSMGVNGYASDAAMSNLKTLKGAAFDAEFGKLFAANLKGQLELASALTNDVNPNLSKCLMAIKQQSDQLSTELQQITGN